MLELEAIITQRRQEAEDICSFVLEASDGQPWPAYMAGAHIDVEVSAGLVRQYSLCGDPRDARRWRIAVLREPASRGGSARLHEGAKVGSRLRLGRPRNLFELVDAPYRLLLAGGIGITPLLAMAQSLHQSGRAFELHYATRTAARAAFRDEIAASEFAGCVRFYTSQGEGAQRLDIAAVLSTAPAGAQLYVCGPAGFMDAVLEAARFQSWPEARLHREHFGAAPVGCRSTEGFEVRLARSGTVHRVPNGSSVLQVLLQAGISIPYSCEQGVCGTCMTQVLEGVPEHHDQYLTDDERAANDQFMPCCSRAATPVLVLDL